MHKAYPSIHESVVSSAMKHITFFLLCCCSFSFARQPSGLLSLPLHNRLCANVFQGRLIDSAIVVQNPCNNTLRQQLFSFEPVDDTALYRIRAMHSGKCLSVRKGKLGDKVPVVQEPCYDDLYQLWNITNKKQGNTTTTTALIAAHSKKCLSVRGGNLTAGVELVQATCNSTANYQKWNIGMNLSKNVAAEFAIWQGPYKLGIVPVAASQFPDGRILAWSSYNPMDYRNGTGKTWTTVFDPATGKSTDALITVTHHDMFCPGTMITTDGRLMVSGGQQNTTVSFFDFKTETWTLGPPLNIARGYHTMELMANGSIFTLGGSWSGALGGKNGEVWTDGQGWDIMNKIDCDGTSSLLTNDARGIYRADNHMWLFTAPNGGMFHAGPSKMTHWIDLKGEGKVTNAIPRDTDDAMVGNAIMYDVGKILTLGGGANYDDGPALKKAHIININKAPNVTVKRTGDLNFARMHVNSVVLPSGEVVVTGGQSESHLFFDYESVYFAEIWNPVTGTFTTLPPMRIPRNYHSTAVLLKDGRVWTAGGGLCGSCPTNHLDAEILTPPYLLNPDGSLAKRPKIVSAPSTVSLGQTVNVTMDTANPHKFALLRLASVTHSTNNGQRRVPIVATSVGGGKFRLAIPSSSSIVLPGPYYLFALNNAGVPSVAASVFIKETQTPTATTTKLLNGLSKKCAEVNNGLKGPAVLVQNNCTSVPYQKFRLEPVTGSAGYYRLVATHSEKCMAVPSSSAGANVVQATCVDSPNQHFRFTGTKKNFQIRSELTDMCIKPKNNSVVALERLIQAPCQNLPSELWTVTGLS